MTTSAATSPSPRNVTTMAGTVRPGQMKSTTRIAAASRIVATNGAMTAMSWALIGRSPQRAHGDRRHLLHGAQRGVDGAGDEVDQEPRVEAEHHHERAQRHEREGLHRPHV